MEGKCSATFTAISTVIQGLRMQLIPLWKGIFIILTLVLKNVSYLEILRLLVSKTNSIIVSFIRFLVLI